MIEYFRGPYGANLLFRWHGSALAKAFIPGLLAIAIFLAIHYSLEHTPNTNGHNNSGDDALLNHPYAIGVLVSSVSFLIIFRANYGYQRYWEACSTVHQLMSKWMDSAMYAGVFHLQSEHYNGIKPPTFFDHDDLNRRGLSRDREDANHVHENHDTTTETLLGALDKERQEKGQEAQAPVSCATDRSSMRSFDSQSSVRTLRRRRYRKSINETKFTIKGGHNEDDLKENDVYDESHLLGPGRLDGGWGKLYPHQINNSLTATYYDIQSLGPTASRIPPPSSCHDQQGFASTRGGRTPSLFLQELAHLSSLLCAVALTTLRNDLDDVESPLGIYIPGAPWPEADPLYLPKHVKRSAYQQGRVMRNVRYLLGMDQTKASRTKYNAARPMLVIGGVSDAEIAFIQRARGPYAKTQLVWIWLSEFIIREHLAGSLGKVGPPIVSRIVQFMSDGTLYYNHARKIMYTPFPFPHAQLSAFFVLSMVVAIPFLMDQYTNEIWLGAVLSFLTVTCLAGLHEVARELENPFRNAPNDVPLCTMLAFYNEALITMFAGYHPDAYWDEAVAFKKRRGGGNANASCNDDVGDGEEKENGRDRCVTPDLSEATDSTTDVSPDEEKEQEEEEGDRTEASALPQSIDGSGDSLKMLREMIESQSAKIKELQDRMQHKERRMKLDELVIAA